jgi:hypothetical protein
MSMTLVDLTSYRLADYPCNLVANPSQSHSPGYSRSDRDFHLVRFWIYHYRIHRFDDANLRGVCDRYTTDDIAKHFHEQHVVCLFVSVLRRNVCQPRH